MSITAIIFLGAPGAGKGTLAAEVAVATGYEHLSTGDMLREAIKQGTELGRTAELYIKQGNLVPDDTIVAMVVNHLRQGPLPGRYILDGFPRTMRQAELLDSHFQQMQAKLAFVFLLDVSREVLFDRLTGRRVCRKCGAIYHVRNIPPKRADICDACGSELFQRPDDMPEVILKRFDVFTKQTRDLIAFYEQQAILMRVDSSRPKEQVVAEILKIMAAEPRAD